MFDEPRQGAPAPETLNALRRLSERSPTPMLLTEGPNHLVLHANPAVTALLAGASPVGCSFAAAFSELPVGRCGELLDRVYRTGETQRSSEIERVDAHGRTRVLVLCAWPADDDGDGPRRLIVEARDITAEAHNAWRGRELAEETRAVNERLVVAGVRMQELVEEAEAAQRRLEILAEAGALLSASFDTSTMLPSVARLLVPRVADVCAVDLLGGPGACARTVIEHRGISPETERAIVGTSLRALGLGGSVARMIAWNGDDDDIGRELKALGFAAGLTLPLRSRTRVQGVLTLLSRRGPLDLPDITLTVEIADRIAMALDRVELYQKAVSAARAREELLGNVSHDLRSPLHTILFSAALLEKSPMAAAAPEARHVERIQRTAEYMQRLLRDLVDSAKIEAHRFLVDPEPCAVASLVEDVVEMMVPLAASKAIQLETTLDDSVASSVVWLDRVRMAQVLTNLVGNAVKFTPERGRILIRVALRPGKVVFSVKDSGPGIPQDDLPSLFDRFWQARKTAQLGTGLGLFIARGIVLAHGGTIWAESEPGASSTFFVTIPTTPRGPARDTPSTSRMD